MQTNIKQVGKASPSVFKEGSTLIVDGIWSLSDLGLLDIRLKDLFSSGVESNFDAIEFRREEGIGLNILGVIFKYVNSYEARVGKKVSIQFSSQNVTKLYDFLADLKLKEDPGPKKKTFLSKIGFSVYSFSAELKDYFNFASEVFSDFILNSLFKGRLRVRELVSEIDKVAVSAVPIVAMVTFLIGIVISYLLGNQLQYYGANIFVVDGIAAAMCRELSPILVAIILAGRSGSAFSAELGSMKMNQEVDSISVLGLSVNQVLVIPRILALFLCIPILVFVGDFFGILGGLFVANVKLDVGTENFLDRLQQVLYLKNVYIGLLKGPLFALFIGSIACHLGLGAEPNAVSIGKNTTSTVVRSIVSVIILNAICAVILSELKL